MSLLDLLEPEELVGRAWHRLVGDAASYPRHPDAAVSLEQVRGVLGVFFRGLGGDVAVQLTGAARRESGHRLSWRQKLGMAAERTESATLDGEALHLPLVIDVFPDPTPNRDLYFWLAAFFAHAEGAPPAEPDPLRRDLAAIERAVWTTARTLAACPGLAATHRRLCGAVRAARPARRLPEAERAVEGVVVAALSGTLPDLAPLRRHPAPPAYRPFLPVPLWGEVGARTPGGPGASPDGEEEGAGADAPDRRRRTAQRRDQDQAERDDSLILNMENLLGVGEMVNLNRAVDDDDQENARKAADDLDEITLSKHRKRAATRLKLDLDLPPGAIDPTRLAAKRTYPEWDHRRGAYRPNHCAVLAGPAAEEGEDWTPDAATRRRIRRVRRQFEALRPRRVTLPRQADGFEIDMDAVVRSRADLAASGLGSDAVYVDARPQARDLAVALLVDVSLSTDGWIDNRRVLDVEKEALTILASGLEACGDDHAIYTFTSRKRDFVRIETVKGFDERFGPAVSRRIAALKPGYYTRIGAAVRHATAELNRRPHRHRLLLVLTDGKPNDVDHYEGRYGVEDTRMAVREARRAGLAVFGVTVDREARDYFPYVFGRGSYHIVGHVAGLGRALPKIYRQLVG